MSGVKRQNPTVVVRNGKSFSTDQTECVICHKQFYAVRRYEHGSEGRYCSIACRGRRRPHNILPIGARRPQKRGYITVKIRDSLPGERWDRGAWIREHTLIAEITLGRKLKKDEVVHHVNGKPSDNRKANLLICSRHFHRWLHERMSRLYQCEHFMGGN
jgi:hypothetical protein